MQLETGPYATHLKTLNLFAYGTYKDYLENKSEYLELTPAQCKKLQHLTIATLATQEKCIPYSVLLKELDIKNVRDLEDLIIEAIYAGKTIHLYIYKFIAVCLAKTQESPDGFGKFCPWFICGSSGKV